MLQMWCLDVFIYTLWACSLTLVWGKTFDPPLTAQLGPVSLVQCVVSVHIKPVVMVVAPAARPPLTLTSSLLLDLCSCLLQHNHQLPVAFSVWTQVCPTQPTWFKSSLAKFVNIILGLILVGFALISLFLHKLTDTYFHFHCVWCSAAPSPPAPQTECPEPLPQVLWITKLYISTVCSSTWECLCTNAFHVTNACYRTEIF